MAKRDHNYQGKIGEYDVYLWSRGLEAIFRRKTHRIVKVDEENNMVEIVSRKIIRMNKYAIKLETTEALKAIIYALSPEK